MSETVEQLLEAKAKLCKERDRCADVYNVLIAYLIEAEDTPEQYEVFAQLIENLEPYSNLTKERMRELNRKIAELGGSVS
jgi:lipoprotein NlpI